MKTCAFLPFFGGDFEEKILFSGEKSFLGIKGLQVFCKKLKIFATF